MTRRVQQLALAVACLGTTLAFLAVDPGPAQAKPRHAAAWSEIAYRAHWLRHTPFVHQGVSLDDPRRALARVPRRLLLDQARSLVHAPAVLENAEGLGAGQGVVVGIVDSGIDFLHPDLRSDTGATRMAYWIDFGRAPYGFHPALEAEYECDGELFQCAILGPQELAVLVAGGELVSPQGEQVELPQDTLGHGTHVASLALGNGQSNLAYKGIAPEATLIGARVATTGVQVNDLDIQLAARFVFERAQELGLPAVLNLSLGGDMGPHDGTTELERSLATWVEHDAPGRAVVVAAGNSGRLEPGNGIYPSPHGIHTEVHVPRGALARVPILVPGSGTLDAAFFVWIATQPGDSLRVAVEERDGTRVLGWTSKGETRSASNGVADATIVHHLASDQGVLDTDLGIAVIVSGGIEGGSVFSLLLEGAAVADLWIQSEGQLAPGYGTTGALFPGATRERTTTVPATSPDVIAVGAVLNRTAWPSFDAENVLYPFDDALDFEVGTPLYFSSAGPNLLGVIKPDVVAPGGVVIGAMASDAAPIRGGRVNGASMFGITPICDELGCARVDEWHAASLGTSMAAPIVSGAIALLFERDPSLSQNDVRALLQASARRVGGMDSHVGAGLLDVATALAALNGEASTECKPSRSRSWLSFGESFARPGAEVPVRALLHVRAANGGICDVSQAQLHSRVEHASLVAGPTRVGPGLFAVSLRAPAGSLGEALLLEVRWDDAVLARATIPIQTDPSGVSRGAHLIGGCAVSAADRQSNPLAFLLFGFGVALFTAWRRRAGSCAAPKVRDRGRRGSQRGRLRDSC